MSSSMINGMISGVAQPVLTQVKDDRDRYCQVFRKMIRFTSFISFPAMFGLGLYIYAGEDVPENDSTDTQQTDSSKKTIRRAKTINQAQQATDKYAGIKAALKACPDQQSLMNLYQQHKNEVDGNSEIKALFTERKLQLQKAA